MLEELNSDNTCPSMFTWWCEERFDAEKSLCEPRIGTKTVSNPAFGIPTVCLWSSSSGWLCRSSRACWCWTSYDAWWAGVVVGEVLPCADLKIVGRRGSLYRSLIFLGVVDIRLMCLQSPPLEKLCKYLGWEAPFDWSSVALKALLSVDRDDVLIRCKT